MVQVGSFEAKTHLPALLERVAKGEEIQVTRRGVPIANIVPITSAASVDCGEAVRCIRKARKGVRLGGKITLKELVNEGRLR